MLARTGGIDGRAATGVASLIRRPGQKIVSIDIGRLWQTQGRARKLLSFQATKQCRRCSAGKISGSGLGCTTFAPGLKSWEEYSRYFAELKWSAGALINELTDASIPTLETGNLMSKWRKIFLATIPLVAMVGCGGSKITLHDPTIPEPLIDQISLVVAVRFPEIFDHFVHEEQVIGKEKWTIDLGRSNRILFTQLFGSMFTDFTVIENETDARDLPLDALIEPSIDAFEFSVPSQSQTDEFAVWIRYRIKIFDDEGVQIANWPIAAYGKSQSSTFGGDAALRRAAVLAMRDAAALIILQMDKATGISELSKASANQNPAPPSTLPIDEALQTTAAEDPQDDSGD